MKAALGWALALAALAAGYWAYGPPGLALGATVVVFWLLLQFSRAMRMMRVASRAPVGHVDSAVMLNAKLQPGLQMMAVIGLTRSLGRRISSVPPHEVYDWTDGGGARVRVQFQRGRCTSWELQRAGEAPPPEPSP